MYGNARSLVPGTEETATKIGFRLSSQSINIFLNHDSVTLLLCYLRVCTICKSDKHMSQDSLPIVDKNVPPDRSWLSNTPLPARILNFLETIYTCYYNEFFSSNKLWPMTSPVAFTEF